MPWLSVNGTPPQAALADRAGPRHTPSLLSPPSSRGSSEAPELAGADFKM